MMDFDARLEEIRRRSEHLKRKERRRRGMLLTVIPAALCAVICIGMIMPKQPAKEIGTDPGNAVADMEQAPEMHVENYSASIQSVTAIQVTGKGVDKCIDDPKVVEMVCLLFDIVTDSTPNFSIAGAPTGGTGEVDTDGRGQQGTTGKTQSKDHFILAFLDGSGVIREYRLSKSVLTELTTGKTNFLQEDDLAQLYELLHISPE